MAGYEFSETLTLELPKLGKKLSVFSEADFSNSHGLVVDISAIHEGLTSNYNSYGRKALENSLQSWVTPYAKPVLLHHDPHTEPVGRIIAAKLDSESDGVAFTRLQAAITDPEAVQKVMDQRYLTGSVGGKAGKAICSVCEADWAEASMSSLPCRHSRGQTYKGKLAYMNMEDIAWKEYSFVNVPADQRSGVRSTMSPASGAEADAEDGWVRRVQFFSLNMAKEEIVELSESDENRNVLAGMRKKESSPLYLSLKGAFLSALAIDESEDESEKVVDMPEENEDDILAVAEELSVDLSKPGEEEVVEGSSEEVAEEAVVEAVAAEEEAKDVEEAVSPERPAGQEEKQEKDIDPATSKGADKTREETDAEVEAEVVAEEKSDDTELNKATEAFELRVEEMTIRITSLSEENARLKTALKGSLAERVVDTKIALGIVDRADREALLAEHVSRTAGSLADSLRDLVSLPVPQKESLQTPVIKEKSLAVGSEENSPVIVAGDFESIESIKEPMEVFEDRLVDALMGRKSL